MLARLGRFTARRRFVVLAAWVLIAAAGSVFGGAVYDRTESLDGLRPGVESSIADARLDQLSPEGQLVVAVLSGQDFFSSSLIDSATNTLYEVRAIPGVAAVNDAYTSGASNFIADDRQGSLVVVELDPGLDEAQAHAVADQVAAKLRTIETPRVIVGGELLARRVFAEQAIADAVFGESVALVVLCVFLVLMLGGLAAGLVPLAAALAAIAGALLALAGIADVMPVSEYAVNVVTLLGLGLAVDYSLLVVTRFRDERSVDPDAELPELLARTMATAGRAVLVSGLAVAVSLAGLFAFAEPLLAAMAMGGGVAVCLATLAGLTLVPALIGVMHRRIPAPGTRTWVWRRPRQPGRSLLARLAAFSQAHARWVALAGALFLIGLSVPLAHVNLDNSGARSLPRGTEARMVAEAVERDFSAVGGQPITILVERSAQDPAVAEFNAAAQRLSGVADVDIVEELPAATIVEVEPQGGESGAVAQRLVRQIRMLDAPMAVLVAGPAAELVDAKDATAQRLPIAVAAVIIPSAVLLFALTGSVVIPLKALLLNVLTLLATCGALVAIFQWGWGAAILGFEAWGALDITTPLLLFMFIFGLSMDYEVFLLARIKEEWDGRTGEDRAASDRAVLQGITASGPVVTAAAFSIGIVFLGFALGELVAMKEIGVGMALALLLDVTVIRGLLLPATMSLLGRWNWWRPFAAPRPVTPGVPA